MLKPGDAFDRYTIDSVLGQGGMGTVYRAHDTRLERRVAIKVISEATAPDAANARLLREARAAAALDHPNAVSIFDVGEVEGAPFIVMELVNGRTLRDAIVDRSAPVEARVGWLADAARALAAAHMRGLVHRDIKPENVMVREDGVVKVLDFGIARRAQGSVDPSGPTQATSLPTLTKEGVKFGTPLYMAPEQIRSEPLDGRVDQFAWGTVAFELLTGKLPWRGLSDPLAAAASILTDEPNAALLEASDAPADVKRAVLRALSKKPEDRFASMDDLVRALENDGASVRTSRAPNPAKASASKASSSASKRASAASGSSQKGSAGSAASETSMQRFTTEEVRAVLDRAIELQESEKRAAQRLGFDELMAAAREVGVEEETLREASRDLRARVEVTTAREDYEYWLRSRRRKFKTHLGIYAIVSTAFILLGLLTGGLEGTIHVPLWWGIGVAIHGLRAFMANEDVFREENEKIERKERKQRKRREAVSRAVEQGASALLETGASIRQRLRVAPAEEARLRLAVDTSRTREAEAEADAIAEEEKARKRL